MHNKIILRRAHGGYSGREMDTVLELLFLLGQPQALYTLVLRLYLDCIHVPGPVPVYFFLSGYPAPRSRYLSHDTKVATVFYERTQPQHRDFIKHDRELSSHTQRSCGGVCGTGLEKETERGTGCV